MRGALFFVVIFLGACMNANAENLVDVYQQALANDPVFQQAVAECLSDKENVAINFSALLPAISVTSVSSIYKSANSGSGSNGIGSYSQRGLQVNATVTQTVVNFEQFTNYISAKIGAQLADASLNAALQDLIIRVSEGYFTVLKDEDFLAYALSDKQAYSEQLRQVTERYKVGLATHTEVYTAQSAYDLSSADYMVAETQLENDRGNLSAITGNSSISLSTLKENMPLLMPEPMNVDTWASITSKQNWSIRVAQYQNEIALQTIKKLFAGNLPTLTAEGIYNITYNRNTGGTGPYGSLLQPFGASQSHNRTVEFTLTLPIFSGGQVVAQTRQATYSYQVYSQKLVQTVREMINVTRQSYFSLLSFIAKINADKQALQSTKSALDGMKSQYQAGVTTLVDVLNQIEKKRNAEMDYSSDRYKYINTIFLLKKSAGILDINDIRLINSWLKNG